MHLFGLLMVELVLNAIKHAFTGEDHEGTIAVTLRRYRDAAVLSVADDGKRPAEWRVCVQQRSAWQQVDSVFCKRPPG